MKNIAALLLALLVPFSLLQAQDLSGEALLGGLRARQIGPALMSGRVTDLAGHPTDPKILYVGSAGGGVWRSNDGGVTFNAIFDDYPQSIGCVAVDPQKPDQVIWAGTGETWTRNSVSVGNGIYKTTDGGRSWKHLGLEASERISSIAIHPDNPDVVFVGVLGALWGDSAERGVYKTADGGQTWEKIFYLNETTGCSDLAMHPENPDVLYAAFWEFRRTAWSFNSGGKHSALYKSTDGGKTWSKIHNGFPEGKLGRIAVAIAPSKPDRLYAVIESEKDEDKGLYRSEDGGLSWTQTNSDFELAVRPFYFSRLVVSPHDPDMVCKAGLSGSISEDGGKTFRTIGSGVHADVHDFFFNPLHEDQLILGCDGGVYRSWDGGNVWEMVKGLPLSQYYHVTVDNEKPFNVYGGLQDNGSWVGPSAKRSGAVLDRDWVSVGYGDGFRVYPHPEDPNILYSEMQGAEKIWRVNRAKNQAKIIKPYPEKGQPKLRFNWNPPITTSPHEPDRLYAGSQFLHKSEDRGESWETISPDLTTNDPAKQNQEESGGLSKDNSGAENHCTIFAIGESPIDENIIWVGTDDGNVQVTYNGGKDWRNVTANYKDLVPEHTWVYHIEPSSFDPNTAYAVFDGHTQNDLTPYVLKTTDGGKTWTSIATEEIEGFARSIQEDYVNPNLLYLGTEFGLYITIDGGQSWNKFTNNMPAVAVHHLTLHPRDHALVLGTHGRGIIIIDDITPLRALTPEVAAKKVHFFERPPSIIREPTAFGGYAQMGDFRGENPSSAAQIVYYLKSRHTFGKMTMEVFDENGEKVADLSPGKAKGINVVAWNYRYKMPKVAKGKTFTFGTFTTPTVLPGTYTVRLTKGKEVYEHEIELVPDPESLYTDQERLAQHEAAMTLYHMNEDLAYLVDQIDAVQAGIAPALEKISGKKLTARLQALDSNLNSLKEDLVVLTGDNYVGAAEPQLREKIASLYGEVAGFPGPPSKAQQASMKLRQSELRAAEKELKKVMAQLPAINELLAKHGLQALSFRSKEDFLEADI